MRAHFQGFKGHYRLWVHLSQPKHLKLLTGVEMNAHFQGFRPHYRHVVHLSKHKDLKWLDGEEMRAHFQGFTGDSGFFHRGQGGTPLRQSVSPENFCPSLKFGPKTVA